jgi:hypothetical protein
VRQSQPRTHSVRLVLRVSFRATLRNIQTPPPVTTLSLRNARSGLLLDTMANGPNNDGDTQIPGTVHLVDLMGTMSGRHAESGQRDIVLVPAPSSDPDDPLNWSPRRKALSTVCMCVYTLMVGIASAAIYSVLVPISEETGISLNNLNQGTGLVLTYQHIV